MGERRLAVVSGGGTGIGAAVARGLAGDGCDVLIVGRRADVLLATAERLDAECGRAGAVRAVSADLTDPEQLGRVVEAVAGRPVDVVVNNAGGYLGGDTGTLAGTAAHWRANLDANVLTAVLLTEALRPALRRPGGRVILVSSIAAPRYGPPPVFPPPPATGRPAAAGKRQRTPSPGWASATATIAGTALVLLSFGCFTWLVMLTYAAWRRSWRLALVGLGYLVALVVEVAMLDLENPDAEVPGTEAVIFLGLAVVTWLVGAAHVVLLSHGVWAALTGGQGSAKFRAEEERRIRREHACYLLYHYPAARNDLRIGRPELPRTFDDGGLIDVNAVPDQVLAGLPGLTADQCRQIAVDRWLRGPYASLEEPVGRCLLPPTATDRLRELLFFLPPTPAAPAAERTPPAGS